MKKQNRLFSATLYREGLRQCRLIGVLAFVIFELEAVLIPLGRFIECRQLLENGYVPTVETLGYMSVHPLLITTFCVVAPLMTLTLFHFLNKRNASDFYHAIPHTRVSLFFSFCAAILTWILGVMAVTTATAVGLFALMPQYFALNLTGILVAFFNLFAASCLVVASVAIAMSVTGTLFTNLVVSCLILFLPRLLLLVMAGLLGNLLPIIDASDLFGNGFNVVTLSLFGVFLGENSSPFGSVSAGLYTLGLALVYFLIAAWLFHRRRSEAAGQSATGRGLQTVFRLAVSLPVCLIPCVYVLILLFDRNKVDGGEIFFCVVMWIIAVLVYFLYELISTRRWKNLARAVPGLGILALLNLAIIGVVAGMYHLVLRFEPTADEIQSVQILSDSGDYFAQKTNDILCDDPVIRQLVADSLRESIAEIRQNGHISDYYARQRVRIHLKGRVANRTLYLDEAQQDTLLERLSQNDTYRQAMLELPDSNSPSTVVRVDNLPADKAQAVYDMLRKEVPEKGFETWYYLLRGAYYPGAETVRPEDQERTTFFRRESVYLRVSTTVGTRAADFRVELTPAYPRTAQLYLQLMQETQPVETVVSFLRQAESEAVWLSADLGNSGFSLDSGYFDGSPDEALLYSNLSALADWVEQAAGRTIGLDTPVIYLAVSDPDNGRTVSLYVAGDEVPDCLRQLSSLSENSWVNDYEDDYADDEVQPSATSDATTGTTPDTAPDATAGTLPTAAPTGGEPWAAGGNGPESTSGGGSQPTAAAA